MAQWIPQLDAQPGIGNAQSIMDLFEQNKVEKTPDSPEEQAQFQKAMSNAGQAGLQTGAAGGGLGGTLTSAGIMTGLSGIGAAEGTKLAQAAPIGWGVAGGGLILSMHEKKKQEEAAREQARINAEMNKRNMLINLAREASNQDFRLV